MHSSKCLTEEDELDVETMLDLERIYQDIESIVAEGMKIEKLRELVKGDIRWVPTALQTIADIRISSGSLAILPLLFLFVLGFLL
ncbi:MAG: hypothetical protein WAK17_15545 [Candidatus Nitrosopolaris sp.]